MAALAALIACALQGQAVAASEKPPMDQAGFMAYVAKKLAKALPNAHFAVSGPLTIEVTGTPDGAHTFYGDTLYSACVRNADICDGIVADYVAKMIPIYQEAAEPPLKRSDLRVVVRTSSYLAQARRTAATQGNEVVAMPLAGELWLVGAVDRPTAIEILTTRRLAALHLTPQEAMAIGEHNLRPDPADFKQALAAQQGGAIIALSGVYQSSLLAFHDFWRPVAAGLKGPLLVGVPGTDVLLFCDGGQPGAANDLKKTVQMLAAQDERPLSTQILAWTPTGWAAFSDAGP
jgi:hypothetical protein